MKSFFRWPIVVLAVLMFGVEFAVQLTEVTVTAGLFSQIGGDPTVAVWATGMAAVIPATLGYTVVVDRLPRLTLAFLATTISAVAYAIILLLFAARAPLILSFGAYYTVYVMQWMLMPLVTWAIVNDAFGGAEGRRIVPVLAAVAVVGSLAGNGSAALLTLLEGPVGPPVVLPVTIAMMVGLAIAVRLFGPKLTINQRTAHDQSFVQSIAGGIGYLRAVPAFRLLGLMVACVAGGTMVLDYVFLQTAKVAFDNPDALQSFYGTFKIVTLVAVLVIQTVISGWLLRRYDFPGTFAILPTALLLAILAGLLVPGLLILIAGEFLVRSSQQGFDLPAQKSFRSMVPDEQRGRVSSVLDGLLYPIGAILGCAAIAGPLALGGNLLPETIEHPLMLALGVLLMTVGVVLAWRMRASYTISLLNWRVERKPSPNPLLDRL